jgi:hypothetical protein
MHHSTVVGRRDSAVLVCVTVSRHRLRRRRTERERLLSDACDSFEYPKRNEAHAGGENQYKAGESEPSPCTAQAVCWPA